MFLRFPNTTLQPTNLVSIVDFDHVIALYKLLLHISYRQYYHWKSMEENNSIVLEINIFHFPYKILA